MHKYRSRKRRGNMMKRMEEDKEKKGQYSPIKRILQTTTCMVQRKSMQFMWERCPTNPITCSVESTEKQNSKRSLTSRITWYFIFQDPPPKKGGEKRRKATTRRGG